MDDNECLAERFEEHRSHLRAVAYRMLGSLAEADDAVQDTWLRLSRAGSGDIDNLGGWLTTVVARVCLNKLRSSKVRREEALRVHLPDPVISVEGAAEPEQEALLADSVGLALLVVLDTLGPAERLAFVYATCSNCLSKTLLPWLVGLRKLLGSSPAGHDAGSKALGFRLPTPM